MESPEEGERSVGTVVPGGSVRRLVVAAGTARYAHLEPLPAVVGDLEAVTGTFAGLGYRVERRLLDVTSAELREELSAWVGAEPREADALVLYVSGHGEVDHGRHYLLCHDSREDRLAGTALAVEDLVRIVTENGVRRLLLLVDTCYAGQGGAETARLVAEEFSARLAPPGARPRYAPDLPGEGIDLAEQRAWLSPQARRRREELRAHFGPRARGTDQVSAGYSTFTGRRAALATLTNWPDGFTARRLADAEELADLPFSGTPIKWPYGASSRRPAGVEELVSTPVVVRYCRWSGARF